MKKKNFAIVVMFAVFFIVVSLFFINTENYFATAVAVPKENCQTFTSTTFLKSYRLKDTSDTFGITQTSDGGYVITGRTINHNELSGYSMFWIKADKNGNKEWSKLFNNGNSEGYAATQLKDGNFVVAGQVVDFRTDEEQENLEGQGDNFVVKIDGKGNPIWTRTVNQQSIDTAYKLAPTSDGGFVMSGETGVLVGRSDVADIEHTLFLGNFNADGETLWIKKIESGENMTKSIQQTKDGGYVLIGNIKLVKENDQKVPALVKLKKDGTLEWATGLENVPIEIPNLIISKDKKSFTVGTPNKMHLSFGDFISAQQADDGGYIALGRYFSAISNAELEKLTAGALKESSFVAVKVDAKGKFKWARTIKVPNFLEDVVIEKTKDGGALIMGNTLVGGYMNKEAMDRATTYEKMMTDYYKKYPIMSPETPESKKALEKISDEISTWQSSGGSKNIVLIKTDANFQYQWGKVIGGTKNLDGYSVISTSDAGYAIVGTWHTGIKYKLLGSWVEYTEAMILKLDANGNFGEGHPLIADVKGIEQNDVSSYIVTNALSSPRLVIAYPMDNITQSIKVGDKTGVTTTTSKDKISTAKSCVTPSAQKTAPSKRSIKGGSPTPTTKTRPEMKYDETKEIQATSKKGKPLNDELLPILKKVFTDVKLYDDFAGGWVAYRFKRLVNPADIDTISAALTKIGYKIESNANKDFTATKIGTTLNFHFKLGDTNTGQVDVNY